MSEKEDLPEEVKTEGEVDDFLITENEPEPEPQLVRQETKEIDLRKDDPDEDIPDKNIESSKPKKKRERTEAQLTKWGVKYHKLYFGKPRAVTYVDDRAMSDHEFFQD